MRRGRALGLGIVLGLVALAAPWMGRAEACSCAPGATQQTAFDQADASFIGDATTRQRVGSQPTEEDIYRFDVAVVAKGSISDPQDVRTYVSGGLCGVSFELGQRYRVNAHRNEGDGSLSTGSCSFNRLLNPAGLENPAVVREGVWFLRGSFDAGAADAVLAYGNPGDRPLMGDWDGDGARTPGVVRGNTWYLRNANSPGPATVTPFSYGDPGDIPVVGDWDGNGTDDIGVVRNTTWYLRTSLSTGVATMTPFAYGEPGDVPIAGDWDGVGADGIGVFRRSVWHLRATPSAGFADNAFTYGEPGDRPVVGDWDGNDSDTPAVHRRGQWILRNTNTAGLGEISFLYGDPADRAVVWS